MMNLEEDYKETKKCMEFSWINLGECQIELLRTAKANVKSMQSNYLTFLWARD